MLAFASMLVKPAKHAGINVPADPEDYNPDEFPHWHLFLLVQLGAPMPNMDSHWHNARIIATLPSERIRTITGGELMDMGIEFGPRVP